MNIETTEYVPKKPDGNKPINSLVYDLRRKRAVRRTKSKSPSPVNNSNRFKNRQTSNNKIGNMWVVNGGNRRRKSRRRQRKQK
jgi:hypothetical protein